MSAPLAPPAAILRDPEGQRALLPRSIAATAALLRGARGEPVDALPALRADLWRSPWWVRRLRAEGLSPDDLRSLADLAAFPGIDRQEIASAGRELAAPELAVEQGLVSVLSSGTTGAPVRVLRTRYDCLHLWAVLRFFAARHGLQLPDRPRVLFLCALPGGLEYEAALPVFAEGQLTRVSLTRSQARERVIALQPQVISASPEGLRWLVAQRTGLRPALVLSTATPLPWAGRLEVEAALGPVLDLYSVTETGPVAWACRERPDLHHTLAPDVYVEGDGPLRVTRLRPGVLPLLRYLTGDEGRVVEHTCSCGFVGRSIVGLQGRRAVSFCRPDGGVVDAWSLAWLFKHHDLRDFRLDQVGAQAFRLEVCGPAPGLVADVEAALRQVGFPAPQVERVTMMTPLAGKPCCFLRSWSSPGAP